MLQYVTLKTIQFVYLLKQAIDAHSVISTHTILSRYSECNNDNVCAALLPCWENQACRYDSSFAAGIN